MPANTNIIRYSDQMWIVCNTQHSRLYGSRAWGLMGLKQAEGLANSLQFANLIMNLDMLRAIGHGSKTIKKK